MSDLGDHAAALQVQQIIDKGRELRNSFEAVSQSRSDYQLKHFVVQQHETPERQFLQVVIELQRKVSSIRRAQIGLRQLSNKMAEEDDDDERDLLALDQEDAEFAILGAIREFNCLYAMYEALPKFTHEQIQDAEQEYWQTRLARQSCLDLEATSRIGVGNLDALRQADMLPGLAGKMTELRKTLRAPGEPGGRRALAP